MAVTRREVVVVVAVYLGCTILLFAAALLGGRSLLRTDVVLGRDPLFYDAQRFGEVAPSRIGDTSGVNLLYMDEILVARALRRGELPLWNPYVGAGQPMATLTGAGPNPLFLPFLAAPCEYTFALGLVLTLTMAGLAAHFLARRLGASPGASYVAGIGYGFSGAVVAWHGFFAVASCAVLPLGMLAVEWMLASPAEPDSTSRIARWRRRIALALALMAGLLIGHPTISPMGSAFLAAYALVRLGEGLPVRGLRSQTATLVELAGCGMVAAVVALPSWYGFVRFLERGWSYKLLPHAKDLARNTIGEDGPQRWASLLSPRLDAAVRQVIHVSPRHAAPYLGLATVPLAVAGLVWAARTRRAGFVALPVFALGAAAIVYDIPGLRVLRPATVFHYYFFHLLALPAALAAARGVDWLHERANARKGSMIVVAALGVVLAWLAIEIAGVRLSGSTALANALHGGALWHSLVHDVPALVPTALALTVIACFARARARMGWILGAALAVDLIATNHNMIESGRPLGRPDSPALRFLQGVAGSGDDARMTGLSAAAPIPNAAIMAGLYDLRMCQVLLERRYADFMRASSLGADHSTYFITPEVDAPLLSLAAVRYVALPRVPVWLDRAHYDGEPFVPPPTEGHSLDLALVDRWVAVYRNRAAVPRAYLAAAWQPVHGESEADWALTRAARSVEAVAALETKPLIEAAGAGAVPQSPPAQTLTDRAAVSWEKDGLSQLAWHVRATQPSLLVVADSYDPGWHARVDGEPAVVYPTNLAFRGVFVPPGEHEVTMRYDPPGGRALQTLPALFELGGLVALIALRPRRRRAGGARADEPSTATSLGPG